jgi:hypothetical protein
MIEIRQDPYLMDFLFVAARLPQDERDQIEAFSGLPFEIDGAAIGAFMAPGPKWVAMKDGQPVSVGGFVQERRGVWRDFMMNVKGAFDDPAYASFITRHCRKILDAMFRSGQATRCECIVPLQRITDRPELVRWYKVMKYRQDAVIPAYLANGYPAVIFGRVR